MSTATKKKVEAISTFETMPNEICKVCEEVVMKHNEGYKIGTEKHCWSCQNTMHMTAIDTIEKEDPFEDTRFWTDKHGKGHECERLKNYKTIEIVKVIADMEYHTIESINQFFARKNIQLPNNNTIDPITGNMIIFKEGYKDYKSKHLCPLTYGIACYLETTE